MRLQRLTSSSEHKIVEEHEQTLALIEDLRGFSPRSSVCSASSKDELAAAPVGVRRRAPHRDPRRDRRPDIEDLLADDDMVVTITRSGYIKAHARGGLPQPEARGRA